MGTLATSQSRRGDYHGIQRHARDDRALLHFPEGKMDAFKAGFADFYKHTKEGTGASGECLYYGFAQDGNKIFCREGYKSAAGVLAHLGEVKAELDIAVGLVGDGGLDLSVMGPAAELEKLKEALGPLGTKFYALDAGAISKM